MDEEPPRKRRGRPRKHLLPAFTDFDNSSGLQMPEDEPISQENTPEPGPFGPTAPEQRFFAREHQRPVRNASVTASQIIKDVTSRRRRRRRIAHGVDSDGQSPLVKPMSNGMDLPAASYQMSPAMQTSSKHGPKVRYFSDSGLLVISGLPGIGGVERISRDTTTPQTNVVLLQLIAALRYPETKPTDVLYELAEQAQSTLKMWQDEWMILETRVSRSLQRTPRNPRALLDPVVFEDQKEAALYGFEWDPSDAKRGCQDPQAQHQSLVNGRELRRRNPAMRLLVSDDDQCSAEGLQSSRLSRSVVLADGEASELSRAATENLHLQLDQSATTQTAGARLRDTPARTRGRPPRFIKPLPVSATSQLGSSSVPYTGKRRGRPPKNATPSRMTAVVSGEPPASTQSTLERKKDDDVKGPIPQTSSERRSAAMRAWWKRRKAAGTLKSRASRAEPATEETSSEGADEESSGEDGDDSWDGDE